MHAKFLLFNSDSCQLYVSQICLNFFLVNPVVASWVESGLVVQPISFKYKSNNEKEEALIFSFIHSFELKLLLLRVSAILQ